MRQNKVNPFDIRLLDRLMNQGKVSKADYEKHLNSLPDDEANCEIVTVDQDENEVGSLSDDN